MDPATKNAPGEQPEQTVEPTGVQPSSDPQASPLEGASDEDLMNALEASEPRTSEPEAPEPEAPTPATNPTAKPATTPEGSPTGEDEPKPGEGGEGSETPKAEEQPGPSAGAIKRLSVKGLNPDEQRQLAEAVQMVREGKADSIPSALADMGVMPAAAPAAPAAEGSEPTEPEGTAPEQSEPESPQSPPADATVESLKAEIADLRAQRRQAVEDFDTAKQAELTDEIEDKILAMSEAQKAADTAKVEATRYESEYNSALDRVEAKYPEAADESSAFYRVLDDRVARMQSNGDARVADPLFIEQVAEEVAADLGRKAHVAPAPTQPARKPVGSALVPGSSQAAATPSEEDARRWVHEAPIEELEEAIFTE